MVWAIITIITFIILWWMIRVPCIIRAEKDSAGYRTDYNYYPVGLKIWTLLAISIISLIPVLNIIMVIVGIIFIFVRKDWLGISWTTVFPNGRGILLEFLNKDLTNKK